MIRLSSRSGGGERVGGIGRDCQNDSVPLIANMSASCSAGKVQLASGLRVKGAGPVTVPVKLLLGDVERQHGDRVLVPILDHDPGQLGAHV